MLAYLRVENFAVVEKVELDFSANLNVLTGETGAGKSILIDAISFFLKKKFPEISPRKPGATLLVEAMFTRDDEEFVFRREVRNGRSLCFINGQVVPFTSLKEKAEKLLNIYGQNEHTFLLNSANHRMYLDKFCRNRELLTGLALVYKELKKLISELDELKRKSKQAYEKIDFINFQVSEIENLGMQKGEDSDLEQQVKILSSAEEIIEKSNSVTRSFYDDEGSVYNKIADNLQHLEYLKDIYPELKPLCDEAGRFYNLLPEISSQLSEILDKVEYSEEELNNLENKLLKLNRLKAKYNLNLDQLLDKSEGLKKEKEELLNMDFSIKDKQKEIDHLFSQYKKINSELRYRRREKAKELSAVIENELTKLEMKHARFLVEFVEVEPDVNNISDKGSDRLEFYFTPNPGQKPGQIKNVASGGELSRLMLVLKSLIKDDDYSAYIFDEIDSGIGGKTAEFVGEKLKRIAEFNQVICISHLPQIASFAGKHFLVSKEFSENETFSYVKELSREEQVREIARLMVGSQVNDDVLKAAKNLLARNSR
ncbi:MAG: DNA repair protein RecN [Candidatus Aminicenantes bacterium]|nr:DNA repair protein RecN [Candidatus Aminicenantes bacterium]